MSCVLHAIGASFDVDAFLTDSELVPSAAYRRGEPKELGQPEGPKHRASGFSVGVSNATLDDLPTQVQEAIQFLNEHEDELRRLSSFPGLEEVCLDFGIRRRNVAAQSDIFPAELLWRSGALDIDLVVTNCTTAGEAGKETSFSRGN